MTEATRNTASSDAALKPRRSKLRAWFYAGFLLAFIGQLLFTNHSFYTGDALVRCKLWRYYMLAIERAFTSTGMLGPTSGTGIQAFLTFLTHVVMSSFGGLAVLAMGAVVRRIRAGGRANPERDSPAD